MSGSQLPIVLLALVAFFAGLAVLVAVALGALTRRMRPGERMRDRLAPYTVSPDADGRSVVSVAGPAPLRTTALGSSAVARSAVGLAERVVARRGLDAALDTRLEAAGLPLRSAEWLLLHVSAGVGGGLLMLLLSGGAPAAASFGLLLGLGGPWAVLVVRQGRREKAFLAQLPDVLQLLAGSLKAGYSLPQSLDTAVRQCEPPMSSELGRALLESRLGVPTEDALERIGERLNSDDFSWVVMAIRIQREVGGNLAELLTTVAETLRERERLRRQVDVLSAEGRLSGIILGLLPIGFAGYLLVARPAYLLPMLTPFGIVLAITAVVLLTVGGIWVAKVVTVEV